MLELLKNATNVAYTENGAVSYATTSSYCLDLFATAGALHRAPNEEITNRFMCAFAEDRDLAMKLAFFSRDVRGGLGERRVFRTFLRWLARNERASIDKNIHFIAEFGRFNDLLALLGTPSEAAVIEYIKKQLDEDLEALTDDKPVSLLGKWLPSVNASNAEAVKQAKRIASRLGMTNAVYRKVLSRLRKYIRIIENNLREKDYTFDYAQQPSKAMYKYRKAFMRNDKERYQTFMQKVASGEAKLHAGTLTPYDIIAPLVSRYNTIISDTELYSIDVTWNAQENFAGDKNALVVVDGSGSMYDSGKPLPAAVALSLGIYFAERNTGAFHNHFITFSGRPKLVEIKGKNILEKVRFCENFNEAANTNIQKVFELILKTAVKNRVPQNELPETLYFISDMEFDHCTDKAELTNFEYAKRIFEEQGYTLPRVVFWNIDSRNQQQPVTQNEQGVALVSGCTPRIFSMLASGTLSPCAYMMEILGSERYAKIAA